MGDVPGSADRSPPTATVLMVFGRGVVPAGDRYTLTPASVARVRAAEEYVTAHAAAFSAAVGRIVFSGGWAEACSGAAMPPYGSREGELMLDRARAAGLGRYADLRAESRSRSTLENLIHTVADGLLAGYVFTGEEPLGLVSHPWHLPRVRFLARKVLGLRGAALLDIPARGDDGADGWPAERLVRLGSRLCFAGTRDAAGLLRRERGLVASARRLERLVRRPGS
jgi:hypothetical protein